MITVASDCLSCSLFPCFDYIPPKTHLAHVLGFARFQEIMIDYSTCRPPNCNHNLLMQLRFGKVFWCVISVQSPRRALLVQKSYRIHFLSHGTMRSRNG
ncbi:hypothetical protein NPIL_365401 [Nephila pilipes]|uniref:Uncharacterized protein n=1 Tax=Nephila pilipes TaxID=299642 RepID=A0A8X6QJ51_NEPPI|nr:hypothetical protein NPIL_365401 [Nephila pilipes]